MKIPKIAKSVFVGITNKDNKAVENGLNLATLAQIHEFGAPSVGIPERSFLRKPLFQNRQSMQNLAKNTVSIAKTAISQGITPALKPTTIKRKGAGKTTPLIYTGVLRNSISWEAR
ncbi:hypothetical protein U5B43_08800 [Campylobacter sp. 9BO]|uniref:hypothetical protein n=1 Tax=Campylobacter sp. 9BO TaxID=3424759 RepID=UPI003D348727